MRRVWVSPYTLRARRPLSALTGSNLERHGALLKVETTEGVGFGDLHPWPELGDQPLHKQLAALAKGDALPLAKRSLALAELDSRARSRGVSAFAGLPQLPVNHRLLTDRAADLTDVGLRQLLDDGVRTLKLKLSSDWVGEAQFLSANVERLGTFRLRLDFNGQLRAGEFVNFLESLPSGLRERLEFVEDPIALDIAEWNKLVEQCSGLIAIDRGGENLQARAAWMVFKPAAQNPSIARERARLGAKLAVTSYLDHPVGQIGAALETTRLLHEGYEVGTCGLASQFSYETHEFSEALVFHACVLYPPAGTGIGFDELLNRQVWRELR